MLVILVILLAVQSQLMDRPRDNFHKSFSDHFQRQVIYDIIESISPQIVCQILIIYQAHY